MKIFHIPLLVFFMSTSIFGQKEEAEIMQVVNNVFEAMRTNDSTLLKQCFTDSPNTFTVIKDNEGATNLRNGDFQRFVDFVGTSSGQIWSEPIWNEKVEIDGDLASVWVDYALYRDDEFIHCGIDAFHLVKLEGTWKIFHLVDTRRKANCEIPADIKP